MSAKTYLVFGVSKGLGRAICKEVPSVDDRIFGVSRSAPAYMTASQSFQWIQADLAHPSQAIAQIKSQIGQEVIDYLIYNVGIWEHNAFEQDYDFQKNCAIEISTMITTNITSCIVAIQALLSSLKQSKNAKIILIGSTWGLDNHNGREVTFSASKFALRGIAHALRENLRSDKIGVSVLNLGYLATEYDEEQDADFIAEQTQGTSIPLPDVLNAIRFILNTSVASCVKEINMPAMLDRNV